MVDAQTLLPAGGVTSVLGTHPSWEHTCGFALGVKFVSEDDQVRASIEPPAAAGVTAQREVLSTPPTAGRCCDDPPDYKNQKNEPARIKPLP